MKMEYVDKGGDSDYEEDDNDIISSFQQHPAELALLENLCIDESIIRV